MDPELLKKVKTTEHTRGRGRNRGRVFTNDRPYLYRTPTERTMYFSAKNSPKPNKGKGQANVMKVSLPDTPLLEPPTLAQAGVNVPNKDEELIAAVVSGPINTFITTLNCLIKENAVSQAGLDLALIEAIKRGSKLIMHQLFHAGAKAFGRDEKGNTALMIAAENGYLDMARFLLKKGSKVNAANDSGETALILAVRLSGCSDMISLLLSYKADVNRQTKQAQTAIFEALENRDLDAIKILLDAGALMDKIKNKSSETGLDIARRLDLDYIVHLFMKEEKGGKGKKNVPKGSALMKAATSCNVAAVRLLLDCRFIDINKSSQAGTALTQVVRAMCGKSKSRDVNEKRMQIVKLLLQNGARIDEPKSVDGNSLILATKAGLCDVVQLLCADKSKLNSIASNRTALMVAVETGRVDLVNILLDAGADLKIKNSNREDALLIAFKYGILECAKVLLQRHAELDGLEAARLAVENKQKESLLYLANNYDIDVNKINLLHKALVFESEDVVNVLIKMGADVNKLNDNQTTPLMLACSRGVSFVQILLNHGADVNLGNDVNGTPLIRAVSSSVEVAELLIQQGADVNKTTVTGETALMQACEGCGQKSLDMIELLLESKADVNMQSESGETALHAAVSAQNAEGVHLLLQNGADVNLKSKLGETPLLLAAESGNVGIIKLLINAGADVNVEDSFGCNALLRALRSHSPDTAINSELINLLAFSREHINKQNLTGYTPLMLATEKGNYAAVKSLLDLDADVNIVNSTSAFSTITALSILLEKSTVYRKSDILCLEELLKRSAMSSLPHHCKSILHKMIVLDNRKLIQLLVTNGMAPCNIDLRPLTFRFVPYLQMQMLRYNMSEASPLSAALTSGNPAVARYLARNLFLCPSDLGGFATRNRLRDYLETMAMNECVEFVDEFTSQPMSLVKMCLVTVSAALGPPPGRKARVESLPLPNIMKDKLLFKHEEVPMDFIKEEFDGEELNSATYDISDDDEFDDDIDDPSDFVLGLDDPMHFFYESDSDKYLFYGSGGSMYESDDAYMFL